MLVFLAQPKLSSVCQLSCEDNMPSTRKFHKYQDSGDGSNGNNEDNDNSSWLKRYCLSRRVPVWCCRWTNKKKITTSTYVYVYKCIKLLGLAAIRTITGPEASILKPTFQTGFHIMPILLSFCLLSDTHGLSFSLTSRIGVLGSLGYRLSFETIAKNMLTSEMQVAKAGNEVAS